MEGRLIQWEQIRLTRAWLVSQGREDLARTLLLELAVRGSIGDEGIWLPVFPDPKEESGES